MTTFTGKFSIKCGCSGDLVSANSTGYGEYNVLDGDGKVFKTRSYPTLIINNPCDRHAKYQHLAGFGCGCVVSVGFKDEERTAMEWYGTVKVADPAKCTKFPCEKHSSGTSGPFYMSDTVSAGFDRVDPPSKMSGQCGCSFDAVSVTLTPCAAHQNNFKDICFTKV